MKKKHFVRFKIVSTPKGYQACALVKERFLFFIPFKNWYFIHMRIDGRFELLDYPVVKDLDLQDCEYILDAFLETLGSATEKYNTVKEFKYERKNCSHRKFG